MRRGVPRRIGPVIVTLCGLAIGCTAKTDAQTLQAGERGVGAIIAIQQSALHRRHTTAKPAVACEGCHELVGGEYLRAKSWPCRQCHPDAKLATHELAPVDSPARECWSCHDFKSTVDRATPCTGCHDQVQGATRAIGRHDPKTADDCATCHRAHDSPALVATACERCHTEPASGHTGKDNPITGCASCHGYHEPATNASARCTNCHRQSRARVPPTATFAKGHVKCVTCHRPHRFVKTEVIGCRGECHANQVAIAETRVAQHRCLGCHANHDVRGSAPRSCETCHAKLRPAHPADRTTRTRCLGCHPPHRGADAPLAVACASCHRVASDRAFHQDANGRGPQCRDCHRPHGFKLVGTGVALCKSCHGAQPFPDAKPIRTHAKHADCFGCHGADVRHQPTKPRAACTSCHTDKTANRSGHARCVGCHDPHTTEQHATCGSCHPKQAQIARKDHKICTNCHEPHRGVQKRPCASCHAGEAASAPAAHQKCTSCHDQHSTQVGRTCGSCHTDRVTGVHAKVDCKSCHRPHGPRGVPSPPACTSCHKALPWMHQVPAHSNCKNCHRSHGEQPYRRRDACLACHKDRVNHEPTAANCIACHNFGGFR